MITMKCKTDFRADLMRTLVEKGNRAALVKAGAYTRGKAMHSIEISADASDPGSPPHSRTGQLRRAVAYGLFRDGSTPGVAVGATASVIGQIGHTHEVGDTEPPKKPPALRKNNWVLAIGGHGPIRLTGPGLKNGAAFAKLKTDDQVALARFVGQALVGTQEEQLLERWASWSPRPRHYPARPFMGPALDLVRPQLPAMWSNIVTA